MGDKLLEAVPILIVMALLCPVHELGHAFFAWLFGVKVLKFKYAAVLLEFQEDLALWKYTLIYLGGLIFNLPMFGYLLMDLLHYSNEYMVTIAALLMLGSCGSDFNQLYRKMTGKDVFKLETQ